MRWAGFIYGSIPWIVLAMYLIGERMYIVLSLVAKTALAWQIFAVTLAPV